MKLPRFKVSNDFYNPTYLILELSQVTIKPAKRRSRLLDLLRFDKAVRSLKAFQTLKQAGNVWSPSKGASFFSEERGKLFADQGKHLFNTITGGARTGLSEKRKGHSFQISHSNFESLVCVSKTE